MPRRAEDAARCRDVYITIMGADVCHLDIIASIQRIATLSRSLGMTFLFQHKIAAHVILASSCFKAISPCHCKVDTLIQSSVSVSHLACIQARLELLSDSLLVQLKLSNLLEDFKEVLEQNLSLLAIQDVMVAYDGS